MRVAVVGGRLQGVEAVYLARAAGWEVTLIDRDWLAPARGLCDDFRQLDVTSNPRELASALKGVEFIVPALENSQALDVLKAVAEAEGIPICYDSHAYAVSSCKKRSNELFARLGVPLPRGWQEDAEGAYILKPRAASGSQGVRKVDSREEMRQVLASLTCPDDWVIQEFLAGPSYSLEVIGLRGQCLALQVTGLEMDAAFDCKRVLAPIAWPEGLEQQLRWISLQIARALELTGIMDVEVIVDDGLCKVLEIDARLPSQTPTAVFKSTGVNMVAMLYAVLVAGQLPEKVDLTPKRAVVYEHVRVAGGTLEVMGEHIMATAGPLRLLEGFMGADEVITNYSPGRSEWVATLIITEKDPRSTWQKRCAVIADILRHHGLASYVDHFPYEANCLKWWREAE